MFMCLHRSMRRLMMFDDSSLIIKTRGTHPARKARPAAGATPLDLASTKKPWRHARRTSSGRCLREEHLFFYPDPCFVLCSCQMGCFMHNLTCHPLPSVHPGTLTLTRSPALTRLEVSVSDWVFTKQRQKKPDSTGFCLGPTMVLVWLRKVLQTRFRSSQQFELKLDYLPKSFQLTSQLSFSLSLFCCFCSCAQKADILLFVRLTSIAHRCWDKKHAPSSISLWSPRTWITSTSIAILQKHQKLFIRETANVKAHRALTKTKRFFAIIILPFTRTRHVPLIIYCKYLLTIFNGFAMQRTAFSLDTR